MKRGSGILMHITSLPSPYGIGTLGKDAYDFVDFLEDAGQKYWQILPIGPTSYGDSPYQSFSSFAGNPFLIDLELLVQDGILKQEDFDYTDFGDNTEKIDYSKIFENKMPILQKAYFKGYERFQREVRAFVEENTEWLDNYSLYMAIKQHFCLKAWKEWDEEIKFRRTDALHYYKNYLKSEIEYWQFIQYLFFKQWNELKDYANKKGIQIIGDIPIYVAEDSVDTWVNSDMFLLDDKKEPIKVAGCPPDAFSKDGQLWGNPLYNWENHEDSGFQWWIDRIEGNMRLYDIIRIDHFRGFESFWTVDNGAQIAATGQWEKGPAMKLFNAIKEKLGEVPIIAEDLGFLTQEVINFKNKTGYPGMKVLQFAFDPREESDYLPHNYEKNCIVYTGTHDNDTVLGWINNTNKDDVEFAIDYLKLNNEEGYHWGFIRGAWSSVGDLAIAQMQDFLGLGSNARMNIPSTLGGNWQWRIKKEALTSTLAKQINVLTKLYGR
ncbi:4-alpha-glucanotransferase [Alkaliphilus peptidifermentans]|uniref:4-alpha-glucanotransferase n=1 Tax=Alkaliphilus peptidifermentans DSM 18978 TaxID=1120976 RepID=A0A1G5J3B7_9FIRM|nr:4-alpha-glucanotransferase [Alkaliphilus peptidifermentans]SCY82674.1 4-alpha-glucanotransferase [Alkaliphilus peptidifermentans DSM 18978]